MKLTEGGKLERPNLCFLCETTPPPGTKVVDTERYFDGWPHTLRGRRYVCEKCVNSMVKFFDLADARTVEVARNDEMRAQQMLRGVKLRLDALQRDLSRIFEAPEVLIGEASVQETEPAGFAGVEGESKAPEAGVEARPRANRGTKVRSGQAAGGVESAEAGAK